MTARTCKTCGAPHYARDYCRSHYLEAQRAGEFVAGAVGRPVGTSTLSPDLQAAIGESLIAGETVSAIARAAGVSRDQVRTVRGYLERLNA